MCVQFVCLHMYAWSSDEMHKRNHFMVVTRTVQESHVPRDDKLSMGLSLVCTSLVYWMPYTVYRLCVLM